MNVFYVGFYYPNSSMIDDLLRLHSIVDFPGYTFQTALLSGLDYYYPDLKVISSAFMSAYPKNRKISFKKVAFSHNDKLNKRDVFTGLINLPIIKEVSKFVRIRKCLKDSIVKGEENYVICYEAHTPFMLAIATLKKNLSKTCLIVPDLPDYMAENKNWLYLLAKKIDKRIINYTLKYFDCFALFSPHMIEKLEIGNKPWVHLEGIYKENTNVENVIKEHNKTILYTGNLGRTTGILDLLDAFMQIKSPNYRLWIRGNGTVKDEVLRRQKDDNRIVYYEPMSKEDLIKLQRRATVLVNPIRPSQKQTRYFFPSKTMEYLASGTPTVMYKLDCLPEDYYSHVFFVERETAESLRDKLVESCEKSEGVLQKFGESARNFILDEKNPIKQAGKIYNLLSSIH